MNLTRRMRGETTTTCDECGKSYVGPNDTPLFVGLRDTGIVHAASLLLLGVRGQLVRYTGRRRRDHDRRARPLALRSEVSGAEVFDERARAIDRPVQ
jgi:hypothetical protein